MIHESVPSQPSHVHKLTPKRDEKINILTFPLELETERAILLDPTAHIFYCDLTSDLSLIAAGKGRVA